MRSLFLSALILTFPAAAHSQSTDRSPFLDGLPAGRYQVGFQSFWRHDHARTWRAAYDSSGKPLPASPYRPVRLNVWYPARATATKTMLFSDYVGSARTKGFDADEQRVRTEDLGGSGIGLRGLFQSPDAFAALMSTKTLSHRDAHIAAGLFPVIVYSLGQGDYTQENTPLCEYLASQGYIVVSVPQLGTTPRRPMFVHDAPSYDNQVRDLAFALATVLERFPEADSTGIAAVGHSMGGVYSLMLAMRYSSIKAVVGLDPSFVAERPSYFYKYQEAPEYDAGNFRGKLLAIHKHDDNERSIVDSLRFTDRTLIILDSAIHADFNGYPVYVARAPVFEADTFALARRSENAALATNRWITKYVTCYLDNTLKGAGRSCDVISRATLEHVASMAGPTEEELYSIMKTEGQAKALEVIANAQKTGRPLGLRRAVMQRIVNELGYANRPAEAEAYKELLQKAFPPNVSNAERRL